MRQQHLALLIAHREVVPAAVVEVAHAGDAHAVAIDDRPRHHRDFRPPVAIMRGRNGDPPRDHAEKQHDHDRGHAPPARKPERPDRERRKGHRQPQAQPGPRQIRIVDGQRGPRDEQRPGRETRVPRSASRETWTGICEANSSTSPAFNCRTRVARPLASRCITTTERQRNVRTTSVVKSAGHPCRMVACGSRISLSAVASSNHLSSAQLCRSTSGTINGGH